MTLEMSIGMPKPIILNLNKETSFGISLRLEKLSGKVILEKEQDMVLQNMVRFLYHLFANYETDSLPSVTLVDIGSNSRTGAMGWASASAIKTRLSLGYGGAKNWFTAGGSGDVTSGIVVGLGTTAPARTDNVMESLIPEGAGVGQIHYNQQYYSNPDNTKFILTREFTNAGSILAVAECGLYCWVTIPPGGTSYQFLFLRDVFVPYSVTVGNGIRCVYTWQF